MDRHRGGGFMNVHFTKKAYKVKIVMKGEAGGGAGGSKKSKKGTTWFVHVPINDLKDN